MRHTEFGNMGAAVTSADSRSGDRPCMISHPAAGAERGKGYVISFPPPGELVRNGKKSMRRQGMIAGSAVLLAVIISSSSLLAQSRKSGVESSSQEESNVEQIRPDEPIDLPLEMLLRLNDTASSVFTKKPLQRPEPLAANVLDTLNPQGKEGEITIPLRGYPEPDQPPTKNHPIYAGGSIGLNTTASLRAGLSGSTWPFDYHAAVEYGSSNGWVDNAKSSLFSLQLGGGYVIGMGYGIFSGGHMGGEAEYNQKSYRLYALPTLPERDIADWSLKGTGTASVGGFEFEGSGRFRRFTMEQTLPSLDVPPLPTPSSDTGSTSENALEGRLKIKTSALGLGWEGNLDLRLASTPFGSINYGGLDINVLFEAPVLAIRAGGGVSAGGGTDGETVTRFAPRAELRLFPFDGLVASGKIVGGIRQTTMKEMFNVNPYTQMNPLLTPEDERLGFEVALHLEPAQSWGVRLAGSRRDYASYLSFGAPETGEFAPEYSEANVDIVSGDFYIRLDSRNEFAGLVQFTQGSLGDGSPLPYMPKWDAEFFYTRRLFNIPVEVSGSIRYIGARQGGTRELDPAILLGFEWSYNVAKLFDVVMEARNLLAQDYELWEGYKERGLYLSFGARTRF